jgi:predicted nucleic acid-binding protein
MGSLPRYLVDTNVLLRLSRQEDPQHEFIATAIEVLVRQGSELCFSLQNIAEFWNVCTRPTVRNGYGLTIPETNERVDYIERTMTLLPDSERVYLIWRQLIITHKVKGAKVHAARLAAIMQAYGLTSVLTLNQPDFLRYPGIQAIHPNQIQPSPR